jgi:hypothetical protein
MCHFRNKMRETHGLRLQKGPVKQAIDELKRQDQRWFVPNGWADECS